jgi:hypothetical protein
MDYPALNAARMRLNVLLFCVCSGRLGWAGQGRIEAAFHATTVCQKAA